MVESIIIYSSNQRVVPITPYKLTKLSSVVRVANEICMLLPCFLAYCCDKQSGFVQKMHFCFSCENNVVLVLTSHSVPPSPGEVIVNEAIPTFIVTLLYLTGGPLHLGDIEDIPQNSHSDVACPCVVCPWHKWSFDLSSGKQVWPPGREHQVNVYPVRTTSMGQIQIGFPKLDPGYFSSCDF